MTAPSSPTQAYLVNTKAAELCPLIEQMARRMLRRLPRSVGLDDLVGAGNLGLVHALSKFDPEDSEWFDGYALQRARGAMLDELRKLDPLGRFERRKINHVKRVEHELSQKLGRKPGSDEVRTAAGLSSDSFNRALEHAKCSFVEPLDTTGAAGDLSVDRGDPWNVEEQVVLQGEAQRALDRLAVLPQRLRTVLQLYYLEDRTLREIGNRLGVTEPRVHQLRAEAIDKLRTAFPAYASALGGGTRAPAKRKPRRQQARKTAPSSVSIFPPPQARRPAPAVPQRHSTRQAA